MSPQVFQAVAVVVVVVVVEFGGDVVGSRCFAFDHGSECALCFPSYKGVFAGCGGGDLDLGSTGSASVVCGGFRGGEP
eukprot:scaffold15590_cov136-Isochrysis_galbana.AAC.7